MGGGQVGVHLHLLLAGRGLAVIVIRLAHEALTGCQQRGHQYAAPAASGDDAAGCTDLLPEALQPYPTDHVVEQHSYEALQHQKAGAPLSTEQQSVLCICYHGGIAKVKTRDTTATIARTS